MSSGSPILTVKDLVWSAEKNYWERDFLRFIKEDGVGSVTFRGFKKQTDAIAAWTMEQS